MMKLFSRWQSEPRADNPPPRVWRDWLLVGISLLALGVEVVARSGSSDTINYRPVAVPLVAAMIGSLLWRRTHPFKTFLFVFGGVIVFDVVSVAGRFETLNVYTAAILLLLMYSLFRWGSGFEMMIGAVIGFALFLISNILDYTGATDLVSGFLVLEFPAATALAVRYVRRSAEQGREQIRIAERETLARELHDTVAHHVSAIAIQAQAGQFLSQSGSLDGATESLAIIEEEAARTLTEMRTIVGALRHVSSPAQLAPQNSITDVQALASTVNPPVVEVDLKGDPTLVGSAVGSAVYRIAQEAVTNARRHARNVTRVLVAVEVATGNTEQGSPAKVHLTVTDDGERPQTTWTDGYGLIGMKERAELLGGTLKAGPTSTIGWQVQASLPYEESP